MCFATDASLKTLAGCKTIYIDGTFKTCPLLHTQLFTIHGLHRNFVVPLIFVLLSDKRSATYYKLFDTVKQAMFSLGIVFNPDIILSDFESGLIEVITFFSLTVPIISMTAVLGQL